MEKKNIKFNSELLRLIGNVKLFFAGLTLGTGLMMTGCVKEVVGPDGTTVVVTVDDQGNITSTTSNNGNEVVDNTNNNTDNTNSDNNGNEVIDDNNEKDNNIDEKDSSIDVPVTEEYDYSAEHIMDLVEDTAFYAPSFKEEQIAAIVIGINLDHISDEDMTKLSEKYGSLEDLNQSYLDGLDYMNRLAGNYSNMLYGEKYSEELRDIYKDEKIDFKHMVISEDYKDIAQISENSYYTFFRTGQLTDSDVEKMNNLEKNCSEEKAFDDLLYTCGILDEHEINNPYTNVLGLNMTK